MQVNDRLQIKWDLLLMKTFYMNPNFKIWYLRSNFINDNNIGNGDSDSVAIKRTSSIYIKGRVDVYQFVATRLKPLYKILDKKEIDDIFDIAIWLKGSSIDTLSHVDKEDISYFKEANKNNKVIKMDDAYWTMRRLRQDHLESYSRRNWSVCKWIKK